MPSFYGTFMQKQPFKNCYVEIQADDEALARSAMFEQFGDKFCGIYGEDRFAVAIEPYGLRALPVIQVFDHAGRPADKGLHNEYRLAGE